MRRGARSLRCSICSRNFPLKPDYEVCPVDKERTHPSGEEPMDEADAHSVLAHAQFEDYLEETGQL